MHHTHRSTMQRENFVTLLRGKNKSHSWWFTFASCFGKQLRAVYSWVMALIMSDTLLSATAAKRFRNLISSLLSEDTLPVIHHRRSHYRGCCRATRGQNTPDAPRQKPSMLFFFVWQLPILHHPANCSLICILSLVRGWTTQRPQAIIMWLLKKLVVKVRNYFVEALCEDAIRTPPHPNQKKLINLPYCKQWFYWLCWNFKSGCFGQTVHDLWRSG